MAKSFRDLEVWRLGLELVEAIYRCTAGFPKAETYGLTGQMRSAAISIPSNIAEGQARGTAKEFLHFLSFAIGSLAELQTQIELAVRLGYADAEIKTAQGQADVLGRKLHSLRASIRVRSAHQQLTTNN